MLVQQDEEAFGLVTLLPEAIKVGLLTRQVALSLTWHAVVQGDAIDDLL